MPFVDPQPGPRPTPLQRFFDKLSDARLVTVVATALFILAAWPLLLVRLPPLQDLPNHVAAAHIAAHSEIYPQYTVNGFFKSNSLLPLWLELLAGQGGPALFGAARAFTALVLALNALALPLFVLRFAGRRAVPTAALFFWPLVHGFFLSMGMMNFAAGVALALILLVMVDRQRERPTLGHAAAVAVMAALVWYAHAFPLAVVAALVGWHVVTRRTWSDRWTAAVALFAPLVPAALLAAVSAQHHFAKVEGATSWARSFSYLNPPEIVSHLWTDVSGAFTPLGITTIVPALLLPWFVWRQRHAARPPLYFLTWPALALLGTAYVALPAMMSNWGYFHCRLVPFLWAGLLVRLPVRVPRPMTAALIASALAFSAATGIDYVRLDRDRARFTAALDAVPRGAALLPLMFRQRSTSTFTASLTHAWGYYTVERDTAAPLVFAVERSYPITYRQFPPRALIPPALDRFAELFGTPQGVCTRLRLGGPDAACQLAWRDLWVTFWAEAEPRYTHVLTWAMPAEARPMIPPRYRSLFAAGELEVFARD